MRLSALSAGNDFLVRSGDEMERRIARLRQVLEIAKIFEVRHAPGRRRLGKEGVPEEKWFDLMVDGFKRLRDVVEPAGVKVALDNHGIVTNDADLQIRIFEAVGSPDLGANVDTMNYAGRAMTSRPWAVSTRSSRLTLSTCT